MRSEMNQPGNQQTAASPQVIEYGGAKPATAQDQFWLTITRDTARASIGKLEEAAKQLIAVAGFSQTIYFAAISFSNIKEPLALLTTQQQWLWIFAALLPIPLLFWIASLAFAIRVFKPKEYVTHLDAPDLGRRTYEEMVTYKHRQLQKAHVALLWGFVPLFINVVAYILFFPAPPAK